MKDQVLAKIRELCPELMELSFGCEVKYSTLDGMNVGILKWTYQECDGDLIRYPVLGQEKGMVVGEILEILGHEPQLQHIIQALNKAKDIGNYFIRGDGTIFEWNGFDGSESGNHKIKSTFVTLDLTKSFSNQSEEVYQFLAGVLIK